MPAGGGPQRRRLPQWIQQRLPMRLGLPQWWHGGVGSVNASPHFVEELIAALQDTWSKYQTTEGIRNLPEAPDY